MWFYVVLMTDFLKKNLKGHFSKVGPNFVNQQHYGSEVFNTFIIIWYFWNAVLWCR